MSVKSSSVIGGALLISGCVIGAGMLALPVVSASMGFWPSLFFMLLAMCYMLGTGYLLINVTLHVTKEMGHGHVHLLSIADKTLGRFGKSTTALLFLFLFYTIFVAYLSGSAEMISHLFPHLGNWESALLASLLMGTLIAFGVSFVDIVNRLLMLGLTLSFFYLFYYAKDTFSFSNLQTLNFYGGMAFPIMLISFGFHNMVPSIAHYLREDKKKILQAVGIGMLIPLIFYILWNGVILGSVPPDILMKRIQEGAPMAVDLLRENRHLSLLYTCTYFFSFFALATSFLTIALSFSDFTLDGLSLPHTSFYRLIALFLVFSPPLLIQFSYPSLFLKALELAGSSATLLLFGVLPSLMSIRINHRKPLLSIIFLFISLFLFFYEVKTACF